MCCRLSSRAVLSCLAGLFLLASVGLFSTACYVLAQPPQPKQATLPDGLRHVPPDALGFVHLRVGEFLKSDLGTQLWKELQQDAEASKGLQNLEREIEQVVGVRLADVDSVTLMVLGPPTLAQIQAGQFRMYDTPRKGPPNWDAKDRPFTDKKAFDFPPKDAMPKDFFEKKADGVFKEKFKADGEVKDKSGEVAFGEKEQLVSFQPGPFGQPLPYMDDQPHYHGPMSMQYLAMSGPLVIVTSSKPLDRKKMLASKMFPENARSGAFDRGSFLFLSDRTVMLGQAWEVERYSEQMARNPGPKAKPMQTALALASQPHLVVAGGHLPASVRQSLAQQRHSAFGELTRALVPIVPLMHAEAGLTIDLGKNLDLTLQFNGTTEANAEQVLQAVKNLRVLGDLAIDKSNEAGEPGGWKLVLQKQLRKALADAVIEQKGATVRAHLKMEFDPTLVKRFTKEYVATMRSKADRTQSMNNLKQIGLAMHSFHDVNKYLPQAGITNLNDPTGKPLLSWRVAILPYIEQGPLYQQFDLTQPWDHPTNKKLIPRMPAIYVVPGTENKDGLTHYRVLVGPQAMFETGQRIRLATIVDGTSNTIMTVEAKEPTIWTRPDDLPFDPKGPLPKLGVSPDGFLAGFGDGTVRFIRSNTPEEILRGYITRNGGEIVPFPE